MSGIKGGRRAFGAAGDGTNRIVHRTVAAAVVGGTVSEIAGGKFANGAVTGAMVHLFNAEGGNLGASSEPKEIDVALYHQSDQGGLGLLNGKQFFRRQVLNDQERNRIWTLLLLFLSQGQ